MQFLLLSSPRTMLPGAQPTPDPGRNSLAAVPEPVNIAELEALAFERLEPDVHGYFAGGAGDERTLRRNEEAFEGWELRPRVLVDVSEVSTKATVLGAEIEVPVLVAPVAFQLLAHGDG